MKKIITYKIDDSKIIPNGNFKVYYTLYQNENGSINYQLENFNGDILNINSLNGYQMHYLNNCFANFNRNVSYLDYGIELYEGEKAREIKKTFNERYELYKDLCFKRETSPTTLGYMFTIDKYSSEFEKAFQTSVLSAPEEFDDFLKYKVLSEIAVSFAADPKSYGNLESSMARFLDKYQIKNYKTNEILDTSMYARLEMIYNKTLEKKTLDRYDEFLKKIPPKYKDKYIDLIRPDETKTDFEKYYDLSKKKIILDNIEKLEGLDNKVKILVPFSESSAFGTSKNGKIEAQVFSLEQMNRLCLLAEKQVESQIKYQERMEGTYDKTEFYIFIDNNEKVILSHKDRIDIGDGYQLDFKSFLEKTKSKDYLEKLKELDKDSRIQESKVNKELASNLADFIENYDPYEFSNNYLSKEEFIEETLKSTPIQIKEIQYNLQNIFEDSYDINVDLEPWEVKMKDNLSKLITSFREMTGLFEVTIEDIKNNKEESEEEER